MLEILYFSLQTSIPLNQLSLTLHLLKISPSFLFPPPIQIHMHTQTHTHTHTQAQYQTLKK